MISMRDSEIEASLVFRRELLSFAVILLLTHSMVLSVGQPDLLHLGFSDCCRLSCCFMSLRQ